MTIMDSNVRWRFADPQLEHQLQLVWATGRREVRPKCNCGWAGTAREPQIGELGLLMHVAEYEQHLERG